MPSRRTSGLTSRPVSPTLRARVPVAPASPSQAVRAARMGSGVVRGAEPRRRAGRAEPERGAGRFADAVRERDGPDVRVAILAG